MRLFRLFIALAPVFAGAVAGHAFGINVEAETSLGDRFWTVQRLREARYAKLKQGIHERITREALDDAERRRGTSDPELRRQVTYGLLFNDDPAGYLFPRTRGNPKGYTARDAGGSVVNGIQWMKEFGLVLAQMKRRDVLVREERSDSRLLRRRAARELGRLDRRLEKNILWASHFGDLQYLHAMGLGDESRGEILAKMRAYAEHAWSVAVGTTTLAELEAEIGRAKAASRDGAGLAGRRRQLMARFDTADLLYHADDAAQLGPRALGSILHMIQDSYAKGHAVREGWEGENSGRIRYFQNYAEQDGDKHGAFDTHASEEVDNWDRIPGAAKAMERSSTLIDYYSLGCSWSGGAGDAADCPAGGVEAYLFDDVFAAVPLSAAEAATRSHPEIRAAE